MQDFARLNYDDADSFDLKGSYAIAKYVAHKPIDYLTVPNLRATLHANAKGSEVSAVASSVSIVGGIALTAMSVMTAGWTLVSMLPVAGVAGSLYLVATALQEVQRYNAESNLLAQPGVSKHLEHLQDLLDLGYDPRVIAHDVHVMMVNALAQGQKIELKSLAYSDHDLLTSADEYEDDEYEERPIDRAVAAEPFVTHIQKEVKNTMTSILDREMVLGLFSTGIFTPRVVTGESQAGKTSFVNEFAIEAKKQGMAVWLLNLGYSDESPLLSIADRTCLAGWKFATKATPADRKAKIKSAIEMLHDFALESETLLVIDELSTLYLNEALDEVRAALQSAIDEYSIDGRKRRCGIVAIATPLPANKDRDKIKLTGVEIIPFLANNATSMSGFSGLPGLDIDSHKKGSNPSTSGMRFVQMPNGEMTCVDRTSVERAVVLSNVFDPMVAAAESDPTYAVGLGATSSVQIDPIAANTVIRPSKVSGNVW